jgi:hypothetical protein
MILFFEPHLLQVFSQLNLLITSDRILPISPLPPATWKALWKLKLNYRLRLLLWKMVWNILPTKSRISFSIPSSPTDISYSFCSFPTDSLLHLFFSCPIARVVWKNSFWPLDSLALRIDTLFDWLSIILHPETIGIPISDSHLFQIFAAIACDPIWFARNKVLHKDLIPNALDISCCINRIALNHHSTWHTKLVPHLAVWSAPIPPFYKINYDTTIRPSFSAQASVCRDSTGSIIQCTSIISPPCYAILGEATAALLAARLALSLNLSSVILEGDSLTVSLAVNHPDITQDWRIASMVSCILSTIPFTTSWSASHVNQSANFCAHNVTNRVATKFLSSCIPTFSFNSGSFPPCFRKSISSSFYVP